MNKTNKKISLFLLIIMLIIMTSCDTTVNPNPYKGTEYNITYLLDNSKQELNPNTYTAGSPFVLPTLNVEGFIGWYNNAMFKGEAITKIASTEYGDKVFYAKVDSYSQYIGIEYSIKYYIGDTLQNLTPNTYVCGTGLTLPTCDVEGFEGWYLTSDFLLSPVTSIDTVTHGDLVFYGKITENESSLKTALKAIDNYKYIYSYSCTDGEDDYEALYEYLNGNIKVLYKLDDVDYVEYVVYDETEDLLYYYIQNDDGSYYKVDENSDDFYTYYMYVDTIFLEDIDDDSYQYQNGYYVLKDLTNLDSIVGNILGAYEDETYTDFKIKVENNLITHLLATSSLLYEGETYIYNYDITLYDYNKVDFVIPNAETLPTENILEIAEVNTAADDTVVVTAGYVVGLIGNNVYISDGENGLYLYFGSKNDNVEKMVPGVMVVVTGTKTTYNGLIEVSNITACSVYDDEVYLVDAINLSDLKAATLKENLSNMVSFNNAKITSLPASFSASGDNSLTISDGTNTTTLFISKNLVSSVRTAVINFLKTLSVGDNININKGFASCYKTNQITIGSVTTITQGFKEGDEVKVTKVEVTPATLTVPEATSWSEIVDKITVTAINNDNSTLDITSLATFSDNYNGSVMGQYLIKVTYETFETTFTVKVVIGSSEPFTPTGCDTIEDVIKMMGKDTDGTVYGVNRGIPSSGNSKILAIPVDFSDYEAPLNMVTSIEKVLFGTSEETGWESLASYYYKASYGKLNLQGNVLPVYHTGKSSSYYDNTEDGDYEILKAALEYYDATINYDDYDSDGDNYIDAIILIYSCPISQEDDSMYWAYTYEYMTDDYEYYDNVEADFYSFIAFDFINETLASGKTINYNAETFIHESGHLLGLDDYYDTDTSRGPAGGIGGATMMDYNIGDFEAFSKTILGWITPQVANNVDATITLNSFGATGDAIIIPKAWNGTFFDEYYIIFFYTADGLNKAEAGYNGLFSVDGICIYHIDATLAKPEDAWSVWEIYQSNNSTTDHKLISLVEADGGNDIVGNDIYGGESENSDLFKVNDIFSNVKWYDGSSAGFMVKVITMTDDKATIQIDFQ